MPNLPRSLFTSILFFILLALALAPAVAQQVSLPDTEAGRKLAALLEALNSGQRDAIRDFIAAHYAQSALAQRSADERAVVYMEIFADSGGFDVRQVLDSSERTVIVLAQNRLGGDWIRLHLDLEPQPPHGIIGLGLQMEQPPAEDATPLTDAQLAAELRDYVIKLCQADRFSGAVLVMRGDLRLFQHTCGLASRAFQVPNRLDTKFNLGSMNKMFTAVAIAQLAQQGKLSFDDKVGKHLPDYPNAAVREKVTIHQLLTHTSGVPGYFNEKYQTSAKERFRSVNDFLALFQDDPLDFEPGSQWRYSNGGFMLLGAIIEKVSGQSYFDYVRRNIFQPAGMTDTDAYEMDRDTPNLANGYTRQGPGGPLPDGERYNNLYLHVVKGGPAGGGFSTVEDLVKFAAALRAHKLLTPEYTELVTTGKVHPDPEDTGSRYAYGFMEECRGEDCVVGHGGGFAGINGQLDIYQDGSGCVVAVLANYDPPAAGRVAGKIRSLLQR